MQLDLTRKANVSKSAKKKKKESDGRCKIPHIAFNFG
jgi:hypothetical protein